MVWVLASALAAGITGDRRLAVIALLFFGGHLWRLRPSKMEIAVLLVFGVAVSAYGYASVAALRRDARRLSVLSSDANGVFHLKGWISSFPYYKYGGMRFEFRTRCGDEPCTVLVRTKEYLVAYGDSLRIRGSLRKAKGAGETGCSSYLLGRGVCGEVRVRAGELVVLDGTGGSPVTRCLFWPTHDRVRREASRALGGRSGIPIALLLGEKGYLGRKTRDAFVRLGISHLLALSGLHLGFVTGLLILVMRIFRRRSGMILIAALGLYVSIVGPILSLFRAFVMAVLLIGASIVKRPLNPVAALVNAFVLILFLNPHAFFAVGFQLSFLATFGVLLCVKTLEFPKTNHRLRRVWNAVRSSLQVSLAAQAFVAPVILHYFGVMGIVSPVATLLFVLPVAFLLLYSGVAVAVTVAVPAAGPVAFGILEWVVRIFHEVLLRAAEAAPDPISLIPPDAYVYYAGLTLVMAARGRMWPKIVGLCGMGLAFGLSFLRAQLF